MSATRTIAVVTAGLSDPSSTRLLGDLLAASTGTALTARGIQIQVEVVELRPLAHALTDHLLTGFATGDLEVALRTVREADAVIAVTPVFSGSYSGLFKTFFDVLEQGALDGTPVLVAATAGTSRHSLVLEHALRPLFSYLHAVVVPTGVFAASEDWGAGSGAGPGSNSALGRRVDRASGELAALVATRAPAESLDQFDRDLAAMGDFEDLLGG
jgi:FMN reductase